MTGSHGIAWTRPLVLCFVVAGLGFPAVANAAPEASPPEPPPLQTGTAGGGEVIATLKARRGHVSVIRLGRSEPATRAMPLQLDDIIVTKRGRATVRFHSDGALVRVGPNSRVQVNESATERDITLFFGRVWAHVVRWRERTTRFRTSSTIAAIRGTELSVGLEADGDETRVAVLEGTVEASNDTGSLTLTGGQSAVSRKGAAPARSVRVTPANAVQWALYYLPVLSPQPGTLSQGQTWQAKVDQSVEAWSGGELGAALDALEGISDQGIRDAGLFVYRASLLLAAGDVESAGQDLERALQLSPDDSDALSLKAIIGVANNDIKAASGAARRAVSMAQDSATARIAQSYVQQAQFDLAAALESLQKAVELAPADALAWARLAEIRSSLGRSGEALEAAEKAVSLQPGLSRTQTVLGFAYLTRVQTRQAREAFAKAIELDADDPLPRLGQGLARIREGDLQEGLEDLEVAISLDPGDALVRSYLGKGYFEAKRTGLDEREYGVAQQADPNDPTSWFYRAITKQTTNRPVEGLRDIQTAIELNDNRWVYRSRLLLDEDLAARSASLGRIFTDLGFQDRALVEGWNAVSVDPGNFSAHRLLADSYAILPRHEIARVSELFQSQMLQPINTTAIQPRLGESSLFLLSAQGPSALAFNEFNPLFSRDQINVQGSFLAGEDDTLAGEGILSGIYKKFSFSAGYSGFKTDGFRENNQQDDQIANAFLQAEVSPSTSIQGEVRYRKLESGDLTLRFDEGDFNTAQTELTDGTSVRAGLRQEFGPSVTLLASYMHSDKDTEFALPEPEILSDFTIDRKEKADSLEAQMLFRSRIVKVVAGGGYFDIDSNEVNTFSIEDPIFGFTDITTTDARTKHTNLYGYGYITPAKNFTVTVGASGDFFEETGESFSDVQIPGFPPGEPVPIEAAVLGEKDTFNPKVGATWNSAFGTTLRGAWFRTLKRTLITDQTLEPTQVAGFNQFYDDASGTEATVYGGALDQRIGGSVFAGAEYTRRELTIPLFSFPGPGEIVVTEGEGDERLARAYLSIAPHPWLALGAQYQYEKLEIDPEVLFFYSTIETQRVPLFVRFFHPSGFSAFAGTTYLKQDGEFLEFGPMGEPGFAPGETSFWVVDAAVSYRLPKRYGFLVFGVNNLTDETTPYQATDPRNLSIRPGRVIFGRVTVAFP
jgi:tetratricopeptide (TPR) repeat protein